MRLDVSYNDQRIAGLPNAPSALMTVVEKDNPRTAAVLFGGKDESWRVTKHQLLEAIDNALKTSTQLTKDEPVVSNIEFFKDGKMRFGPFGGTTGAYVDGKRVQISVKGGRCFLYIQKNDQEAERELTGLSVFHVDNGYVVLNYKRKGATFCAALSALRQLCEEFDPNAEFELTRE